MLMPMDNAMIECLMDGKVRGRGWDCSSHRSYEPSWTHSRDQDQGVVVPKHKSDMQWGHSARKSPPTLLTAFDSLRNNPPRELHGIQTRDDEPGAIHG